MPLSANQVTIWVVWILFCGPDLFLDGKPHVSSEVTPAVIYVLN